MSVYLYRCVVDLHLLISDPDIAFQIIWDPDPAFHVLSDPEFGELRPDRGCGSGTALRWPSWIRIRIRDADSGSGSRSYKITEKWKKLNIFLKISLHYCEGL